MRYRGAAMAEFWRALKTLKALQAEQHAAGAQVLEVPPQQPRVPARVASRPAPNEPERRPLHEYVMPDRPGPAAPSTSPQRAGCRTNPSLVGTRE